MTNRATLEALLARVLEGTGPHVILDQDIAIALGWTLKKRGKEKRAWWRDSEGRKRTPPRYSVEFHCATITDIIKARMEALGE